MFLRAAADALAAVLIAPECASCARPLDAPSAGPVCDSCWTSIRPFTPPVCDGCGDPLAPAATRPERGRKEAVGRPGPGPEVDRAEALAHGRTACCDAPEPAITLPRDTSASVDRPDAGDGGSGFQACGLCATCRRAPRTIARARAVGAYDGRLRDIVHAFKYDKRRTLGRRLGALMREHGRAVLESADIAVPVPLHWRRARERGFNQAERLAAGLGLPVCRALRRRRRTRSQAELPASRRHANVDDAFALARRYQYPRIGFVIARVEALFTRLRRGVPCPASLDGLTIVLVDDVCTTGATLDACARVLNAAGAKEVRAVTAARVVSRRR